MGNGHRRTVFTGHIVEAHYGFIHVAVRQKAQQSRYFQCVAYRIVRFIGYPPDDKGCPGLGVVMCFHGSEFYRLPTGYVFRSEEHTSELQSLMRISYAVFCLKKKKKIVKNTW